MLAFLQKVTTKYNKKFGNITSVCRPVNRTSKLVSVKISFHKGVVFEAPIDVNYYLVSTLTASPHSTSGVWWTQVRGQYRDYLNQQFVQVKVNAYKKFTTVYRPFMIKIKDELCKHLLQKDHAFYQLATDGGYLGSMGNLLDPCPLTVFEWKHTFWSID